MTQFQSTTTTRYKESLQPKKGKLILTKELQDQIDYLHQEVGNIEWCGVLFHEKVRGEITDPESLVLKAKYIYLMDIGSHAYTEAKFTPEVIMEMHTEVPDAEDLVKGLIHTHHNMSAFFSGTDMSELHDNAPLYNYYLSLIVNNAGTYVARIAYVATIQRSLKLKNPNEGEEDINDEEEVMVLVDLEIQKEPRRGDVDDFFSSRHETVKKEIEEARKAKVIYTTPSYGRYHGSYQSFYNPNKYNNAPPTPSPRQENTLWEDMYSDEYEQEEEKEETKKSKKAKSLPKVGKDGTRLFMEDKEFHDLVFNWLETGLDVYPDMSPKKTPSTLRDLIEFFDSYFDEESEAMHNSLDYFRQCLTRHMPVIFENVHPNLVRRKGCKLMEYYEENSDIAVDFYALFDCYPEFLKEYNLLKDAKDGE